MRRTGEEKKLLAKLASGVLDGMVGDEREYRGSTVKRTKGFQANV